jgi:hypothetical protein
MYTTHELACSGCGRLFKRRAAEVDRNRKIGRQTYCSLTCSGRYSHKHLAPFNTKEHLSKISKLGSQCDEYSPYRDHLRRMRRHAKKRNLECAVTLADLKVMFEAQRGVCPYTGWQLIHPTVARKRIRQPQQASVDRKDSSKGYTKNNIEFVCYMANIAKNSFTAEQLREFCSAVARNAALVKK